MLKIRRISNGQVVLLLSGRMTEEQIAELKTLIGTEEKEPPLALDLKDLTLAGQAVISFLDSCERDGITLLHCAPYIREWITRMRGES
jgi:hypothetical protein